MHCQMFFSKNVINGMRKYWLNVDIIVAWSLILYISKEQT